MVIRRTQPTLLLVGEGDCEVAFLTHLKALYAPRGCGLRTTLMNAHGKGPGHVVDYAVRQCLNADYDLRGAVLDTDLPWPPKLAKRARAHRIVLIRSEPCLEGLLLRILNLPVPEDSDDCKRALQGRLPGKPTEPSSYAQLFDRGLLEDRRNSVKSLTWLLDLLSGKVPNTEDIR